MIIIAPPAWVMVAAKEAVGEDGLEGRRILARAKSNIGPDQGGFAYSLVQVPVPGHELITASIVEWGEGIAGSARDMLAVAEAEEDDQGSALREAKDFLVDLLSEGPRAVKAIQDAARLAGHSPKTLRRAKDALGVVPKKTGMTAGWEWSLPEDDHQNQKMPTPETWAPS
jgi:putative DNA primase/helicase